MSAQVYSVPGQTEGRSKTFLEWKSIDLSHELSLTCGGNVNYYKSVHHTIPTLPVGTGSTLAIFKMNQWTLLSIEFPDIFSSCPDWTGKKGLFWKGGRRGTTWQDYHLVDIRHEKVSFFVKFEIILPLLCFLLDPLTNKHCRAWSSMINLWIDFRTYQK